MQDKNNVELQTIANQKATIRFITRMIFVWFLKEKKLISSDLFDSEKLTKLLKKDVRKQPANYYNAILQNLFFATLNRPKEYREFATDKGFHKNRATDYDQNSFYRFEKYFVDENPENIMKLFEKIPFLNGGLFDSLDIKPSKEFPDIKKEIIDGFSRNTDWQAMMPDFLFFQEDELDFNDELNKTYETKNKKYNVKGLFAIFNEYKFTIEENTPTETDVALDPYLLGEIFENLLAYYNPETGTTARKGSGSFYTPQEIVNYMVDESLKAYLETKLGTDTTDLQGFQNLVGLTLKQKTNIVQALADVKILDPACGSGAFPMGVLYKMVDMLKNIDPDNSIWKKIQHDKIIGEKIAELEADKKAIQGLSDKQVKEKAIAAVEDRLNELETIFNNEYNFDDYARKLYIIQNCIYGVDIQDVAIQISKLRFFLSLIVDQKNEDIKPLPNLETKFVIANTLIGIDLPKLQLFGEDDHSQDTTKLLKEELKNVREQHFKATNRKEKQSIKAQDKAIREKIANSLEQNAKNENEYEISANFKLIEQYKIDLTKVDELPEKAEVETGTLFETKTEITYPRKNKISELNRSIKSCETQIASLQTSTLAEQIGEQARKIAQWDIYNQNASADWFDMDWMFGITDGFDVVIGNPPYIQSKFMDEKIKIQYKNNYETCVKQFDIFNCFIEINSKLLKENASSYYILPDRFIINNDYITLRNYISKKFTLIEIITLGDGIFDSVNMPTAIIGFKKTASINYEFATRKNISDAKIQINSAEINVNNDFKFPVFKTSINDLLLKKIDVNSGKIQSYFVDIRGVELGKKSEYLEDKKSKNTVPFMVGSDVNRYESTNSKYLKLNEKNINYKDSKWYQNEKILFRKTGLGINATLDISNSYVIQVVYILKIKEKVDSKLSYKYSIGFINSKLVEFWYFKNFGQEDRKTFPHITQGKIKELPFKISTNQKPFIELVDQILTAKKQGQDTTALEHQIDVMVYHLYELSYDEALVIDKDLSLEDFEKYKI